MARKHVHTGFTVGMNWWQKAIYYLLWSIVYLVSLLPLRVLYLFSDFTYVLVYGLMGYRKKLVRKNLRDSFPEKDIEALRDIEHRFYHFFCDYVFETVKLASMSDSEMRQRVKYNHLDILDEYVSKGKHVILYLGHYCNWEWVTSIGLYLPEHSFGGQVYHILENKVFNALMLKLRSRMGTESISMQIVLRKIVELRRSGRPVVIGFISDQVPLYQATQYWTTFLNHEGTTVITGTEQIAKKFDFACVYFDIRRPRRGYYEIDIVPICENAKDSPEWAITEHYIGLMESSIKRAPEFWLWTHNRWKRDRKGFEEWKSGTRI